jgi:hypothetical protein
VRNIADKPVRSRTGTQVSDVPGDKKDENLPAPRSASIYPQRSWEELGGRFLGLMAYLDP